MQHYCKTIGALAAASALVAGTASAEVEYEIHTGYTSEYLWRGIDLGDDLFEVGLDAATEYNGFGLSAGAWAGFYDSPATADNVDLEVDFYGEVNRDFGFATLGVGYIYYWQTGPLGVDDQEVYFTASRDLGFASASLTYFWDICENNGGNDGYSEFALSRSWELSPCVALNATSTLGFLTEGVEWVHWTNKVSLDWGFAEHAKLSPFVALSIALGDEASTVWAQTDNEFVAGSMLSVGF